MLLVIGSKLFFINPIPNVYYKIVILNNFLVLMGRELCFECNASKLKRFITPLLTISDYYNLNTHCAFEICFYKFLFFAKIFRFSNRDSIILHKKQHNQEKTHFCSICLKGKLIQELHLHSLSKLTG